METKRSVSCGINNTKRDCLDPPKIVMDQIGIELIECSRQPGKLKLTKKACGRRYLLANTGEYKKPHSNFKMAFMWSLGICKSCPEGCKNAEALPRIPSPRRHRCS
jgi:hypothetical protein